MNEGESRADPMIMTPLSDAERGATQHAYLWDGLQECLGTGNPNAD